MAKSERQKLKLLILRDYLRRNEYKVRIIKSILRLFY